MKNKEKTTTTNNSTLGTAYPTTPTPHLGPTLYQTTLDQERQIRTRLREDRHAALCVLLDRELLTIQALAHQEVRLSHPPPVPPSNNTKTTNMDNV